MDYFNLHTHEPANKPGVFELVNQYPDAFSGLIPRFSIGIHPWRIVAAELENHFQILEDKLDLPQCLAIGECGLDKRIETPLDLQLSVFERQLHLAEQYQKPVVIHCVAAFQEIVAAKKRLNITVPLIVHGFSKNLQVAQNLLDNGFYLSFGKYLLRNPELCHVFASIPDTRFFLETDTIEDGIAAVYARAATCKNMELETLGRIISANYNTVFGAAKGF